MSNKIRLLTRACLLVVAPFAQSLAGGPGHAVCDANATSEQCRLSWNLSEAPRAFHWVQQLDPKSGTWRNLDEPFTDTAAVSVRSKPVDAGYLYRVLACNDAAARSDCAGSTLTWAPIIVARDEVSKLPDSVQVARSDGGLETFLVQKSGSSLGAIIQYNVYMLMSSIALSRVAELPEMTEPRDVTTGPQALLTDADWIQANVYAAYRGLRDNPVPDPAPPAKAEGESHHKPTLPHDP